MDEFTSITGEIYKPFPLKLYNNYIVRLNIKNEGELTFSKLVLLMADIIADLKNEKISVQDFSDIFEVLYTYFFQKQSEQKQDKFSQIGTVLFNGAELNYYSTTEDKNNKESTYQEYINSVMHFYDMREAIQKNVNEIENTL